MPGSVSDSYQGSRAEHPYVPAWMYPNGSPKICPCGHHEGFHQAGGLAAQRATRLYGVQDTRERGGRRRRRAGV